MNARAGIIVLLSSFAFAGCVSESASRFNEQLATIGIEPGDVNFVCSGSSEGMGCYCEIGSTDVFSCQGMTEACRRIGAAPECDGFWCYCKVAFPGN
jgi:hypothetical protein